MQQVARVVVRGHGRQRMTRRHRPQRDQELREIEHSRPRCVLFHRGPAPRGVDHDRVHTSPGEHLDRPPLEPPGLGAPPRVQRQRSAAALIARDDDVAAFRRQHPRRRGVHTREEHGLHASGEHPHHGPALPASRYAFRQPHRACRTRGQPQRRPQRAWQRRQPAVQPGSPQRPQRRGQDAHPPRVGKHREDSRPGQPVSCRSRRRRPLPRGLDQPVVPHPRRACGHARHAAQAPVEVRHRRVGQRSAVQHLGQQVDATARRVHLLAPQLVCRARRQTEAAVHAVLGDGPQIL